MADSSWDNGGHGVPLKPGMPTWAKLLLGCGVVAVLGMATCVGGGAYLFSRMSRGMKNQEWAQLRVLTEELRTDEGAHQVYVQNPALSSTYPTEGDFMKAAKEWRPLLEPLPAEMPSLLNGRLDYNVRIQSGEHRRQLELVYRNNRGARIKTRWENGRLLDIDIR